MRSIFRRTTHFFKERAPELHVAYRSRELSPEGPANVAFHGASSASDRLSARRGGVLLRLCSRTGFPLTPHSDRFPPDRMNGSGLRRPGAPSIANGFSGEPERQSTTSATDVKVEHTRERPVTPRAGVLSADGWPSKACGRQSTGYPAGSRAPALPVTPTRPSFGTRHERPARIEVGTLVGLRDRPKTRRGLQRAPCPKARLRPAARTVRPSNEPGCLHIARNHGSSPWPFAGSSGAERKRPFFTRVTVDPRRSTPPHARQRSRPDGSACDRNDLPAASQRRSAKRVAREQRPCRDAKPRNTRESVLSRPHPRCLPLRETVAPLAVRQG
jgi:hypothetical protein